MRKDKQKEQKKYSVMEMYLNPNLVPARGSIDDDPSKINEGSVGSIDDKSFSAINRSIINNSTMNVRNESP